MGNKELTDDHKMNYLIGLFPFFMTLLFGCSEKNPNHNNKIDLSTAQSPMMAAEFEGHLSNSEVPLKILTIPPFAKSYLNFPSFDGDVGVLVMDGYQLVKRYSEPVLAVSNIKFNQENFATSYSAFRRFSTNENNEINLLFENRVNEKLTVLVYKIPSNAEDR